MTDPTDELRGLLEKTARGGPHEWGYRDPVSGTFVADDWPFLIDAAARRLLSQHEADKREIGRLREALTALAMPRGVVWHKDMTDEERARGWAKNTELMNDIARQALTPKESGDE